MEVEGGTTITEGGGGSTTWLWTDLHTVGGYRWEDRGGGGGAGETGDIRGGPIGPHWSPLVHYIPEFRGNPRHPGKPGGPHASGLTWGVQAVGMVRVRVLGQGGGGGGGGGGGWSTAAGLTGWCTH